jgi:hypothetical protein
VLLRDYLAAWIDAPARRAASLLSLLAGAVSDIRDGHNRRMSKKFAKACDRILDAVEKIPDFQSIKLVSPLRSIDAGRFESVCACPVCLERPGTRASGKYFTVWPCACSVQSANLFYEIGLVLWAILCRLPDWASGSTLDAINSLRKELRQAGHDLGLLECPQCGRFTTCVYGKSEREGFCRWCLDMGGGLSVLLSLEFDAEGSLRVQFRPTDYTAPARNAWDILPPEIARRASPPW